MDESPLTPRDSGNAGGVASQPGKSLGSPRGSDSKDNIRILHLLEAAPHLVPVGLRRVPVDAGFGFIHKIPKGVHLQGAVEVCGRATGEGDHVIPHYPYFLQEQVFLKSEKMVLIFCV